MDNDKYLRIVESLDSSHEEIIRAQKILDRKTFPWRNFAIGATLILIIIYLFI